MRLLTLLCGRTFAGRAGLGSRQLILAGGSGLGGRLASWVCLAGWLGVTGRVSLTGWLGWVSLAGWLGFTGWAGPTRGLGVARWMRFVWRMGLDMWLEFRMRGCVLRRQNIRIIPDALQVYSNNEAPLPYPSLPLQCSSLSISPLSTQSHLFLPSPSHLFFSPLVP